MGAKPVHQREALFVALLRGGAGVLMLSSADFLLQSWCHHRMKTPLSSWHERVEARRIALGLDKSELAHLIGVAPPTLHHWIDGKIKELMIGNAVALCRVLGVRLEWLLDGIEPMDVPDFDLAAGSRAAKPGLSKSASAEMAAEVGRIVKAALPVRQAAMATACRFIVAAKIESLPLIVSDIQEIATTGGLKNKLGNVEDMALVQQFNGADKDRQDAVMALLNASPEAAQVLLARLNEKFK